MLFLVILALFTTFYHGTDNSGVVLGTENCHIGVGIKPTPAIYALCYRKQ